MCEEISYSFLVWAIGILNDGVYSTPGATSQGEERVLFKLRGTRGVQGLAEEDGIAVPPLKRAKKFLYWVPATIEGPILEGAT